MTMKFPDFRSPAMLDAHIQHTMDFYRPRSIDVSGGFFHFYRDDGTVYDASTRHLVSSTRFVFNCAMAARRFGRIDDRADDLGADRGLVAQHDEHRIGPGILRGRVEANADRAREPVLRPLVGHASLPPPGDRTLDLRPAIAQDDHDLVEPRRRHRVERVLEHGQAREAGEQLLRPEPRRRAGREHHDHDLHSRHDAATPASRSRSRCYTR